VVADAEVVVAVAGMTVAATEAVGDARKTAGSTELPAALVTAGAVCAACETPLGVVPGAVFGVVLAALGGAGNANCGGAVDCCVVVSPRVLRWYSMVARA
jgi:hypothetical protein